MNLRAAVGRRTLVKQSSVSRNEPHNICLPSSSLRSQIWRSTSPNRPSQNMWSRTSRAWLRTSAPIQGSAFSQMPKSPGCPGSAIHPRKATNLVSTKRICACFVPFLMCQILWWSLLGFHLGFYLFVYLIVIFQYLVTVCSFCSVDPWRELHEKLRVFHNVCSFYCVVQVRMYQKSFQIYQ